MVREYGFSDALGPVAYRSEEQVGGMPGLQSRPYGDDTQRQVDAEVARLLRDAEDRADRLLAHHRDVFDDVVACLLDEEVLDGAAVYGLLDKPVPGGE